MFATTLLARYFSSECVQPWAAAAYSHHALRATLPIGDEEALLRHQPIEGFELLISCVILPRQVCQELPPGSGRSSPFVSLPLILLPSMIVYLEYWSSTHLARCSNSLRSASVHQLRTFPLR